MIMSQRHELLFFLLLDSNRQSLHYPFRSETCLPSVFQCGADVVHHTEAVLTVVLCVWGCSRRVER